MAVNRVTPYGLKEVADVYFFPVGTTITIASESDTSYYGGYINAATDPDFIFDTLKVSNIEVSSEDTSATGGKGNPELINWSYGKEITFTMEDAVFSLATLDLMFGAKGAGNGVDDDTDTTITVDASTFPSNYYIVGYTYIRNKETGADAPFVFEIPNAKVQVGGTLTMEADGDPTTFEMTIKALQAKDKSLVKFTRIGTGTSSAHNSNNVQ
jgi:hypothetical protein